MKITPETLAEQINVHGVLILHDKNYGGYWAPCEVCEPHQHKVLVTRYEMLERLNHAYKMRASLERAIANMQNLINGDPL